MRIRCLCIAIMATAFISSSFAQQASAPKADEIGKDQAQQLLKEVPVTKMEDATFWIGAMPLDNGLITIKRLEGAPQGKKPIEDEEKIGIKEEDKYVIGVKVNFFRRGPSSFVILPVNPLPIEGITKTISVWVVGRNFNHVLKLVVEDYLGKRLELTMGKMNFMGWKQMVIAIPPTITQAEYHYTNKSGLKIIGFRVECDPMENYGTYYMYLDDVRAVTDLFGESKRDADDMVDSW